MNKDLATRIFVRRRTNPTLLVDSSPGSFTAGGDLSGNSTVQTVIGWENQPLDVITMGAPVLNNTPQWDGAKWIAAAPSGGGGGFASTFANNEVVAGSGTAWTLAQTPDPSASLQLYQQLATFGSVLLVVGTDYTIATAAITTTNSITAGKLRAFYRYQTVIATFADNEVVAGSGTAWTLSNAPSPSDDLELFQYLAGFGWILLVVGTDYTIASASVTTVNSISAGGLRAWYRY